MHTLALKSHCSHFRHEGIHIFRFEDNSRRSVDEWLLHLEHAYSARRPNEPMAIVIEYCVRGVPHLSYGSQRVRQWIDAHPDLGRVRVAFVHNNHALATLVNGIARFILPRRTSLRFFHVDDYDAALGWLNGR